MMNRSNDLRERMSEYAHGAWSGWMHYIFERGKQQSDGTVVIPAALVTRWKRLMLAPYSDLSEKEKDSDRIEADKIVTIARIVGVE